MWHRDNDEATGGLPINLTMVDHVMSPTYPSACMRKEERNGMSKAGRSYL